MVARLDSLALRHGVDGKTFLSAEMRLVSVSDAEALRLGEVTLQISAPQTSLPEMTPDQTSRWLQKMLVRILQEPIEGSAPAPP